MEFYGSLARWWPLISPVDDYRDEAAYIATLLRAADIDVRSVLELGSGGGHVAHWLRDEFDLTLTDLSEDMLEVSLGLNPGCRHVQGDMRHLRLATSFDAVLIHDAVDYMVTEADLAQVLATASAHLVPGGRLVILPDHTAETFEAGEDSGGNDAPDGSGVRLFEWTWDPDSSDTWVQTEYVFVLREADGRISTIHESHRTGLFSQDVWIRMLGRAGFDPAVELETTTENRAPRVVFIGTA